MTSRYRHRHTHTVVAVLTAAAAVLTGCASTTPKATAADPATDPADTARTSVLIAAAPGAIDPGPYRTTPHDDLPKTAEDTALGQFLESQRMAEFLVLPAEIDPELTEVELDLTRTIFDPSALEFLVANGNAAVTAIGEDTGFYAGYSSTRTSTPDTGMVHAVLEFPNPAAAADAAAALHRLQIVPDLSEATGAEPSAAVAYPQAQMPGSLVSAVLDAEGVRATAFTPHGRYILYTRVHAPRDREEWAQRSLARAAEMQRPMIDAFPFTEPADLPALEVDIDGVLRLAVPYLPDSEGGSVPAVYGPRGAAHLGDQLATLDMFADTGATHMAMHGTYVYSTRYDDQAQQLFDRLIGHIRDQNDKVSLVAAAGPPGVPDARCFDVITQIGPVYATCVVLYGTHVGEVRASTLAAAHQVTAAQYLILEADAAQ